MFKKLLILLLIIIVSVSLWLVFALWTGIYSVYTYPPSKEHPDGASLLVTREAGEPVFNSPAYAPPPPKPITPGGGITFSTPQKSKRPISARIIVELPYIDWAYRKSLAKQQD